MSNAILDVLGSTLLQKGADGKPEATYPVSELAGKNVLLYFSAHWCPPCRNFTPKLVEFYRKHAAALNLDVVFVSSDRDDDQFAEYFAEMPWKALPRGDARGDELERRFKVRGIPMLVIVDEHGQTVTANGVAKVMENPTGEGFPWRTPPLSSLLDGVTVKKSSGETAVLTDLVRNNDNLALYFSAHWCPPCRRFTPAFAAKYSKMKAAGKSFEVVFVSSDKSEAEMETYLEEMPWYAIPYTSRNVKNALSDYFDVEGIPTLVILDRDLKVISKDGVSSVMSDDDTCSKWPYTPQPLNELTDTHMPKINDVPFFISIADKRNGQEQERAWEALLPLATEVFTQQRAAGEDDGVHFFVAKSGSGAVDFLRGRTGMPTRGINIIDVPTGGQFKVEDVDITDAAAVRAVYEQYRAGSLTMHKLM